MVMFYVEVLGWIPEMGFEQCFKAWKRRMEKCITAHTDYCAEEKL